MCNRTGELATRVSTPSARAHPATAPLTIHHTLPPAPLYHPHAHTSARSDRTSRRHPGGRYRTAPGTCQHHNAHNTCKPQTSHTVGQAPRHSAWPCNAGTWCWAGCPHTLGLYSSAASKKLSQVRRQPQPQPQGGTLPGLPRCHSLQTSKSREAARRHPCQVGIECPLQLSALGRFHRTPCTPGTVTPHDGNVKAQ